MSLGFASVPISAIGNSNLDVEKVKSVEFGYVGSFGSRARISVDVYRNSMRDFISDLSPGINPAYPRTRPPRICQKRSAWSSSRPSMGRFRA